MNKIGWDLIEPVYIPEIVSVEDAADSIARIDSLGGAGSAELWILGIMDAIWHKEKDYDYIESEVFRLDCESYGLDHSKVYRGLKYRLSIGLTPVRKPRALPKQKVIITDNSTKEQLQADWDSRHKGKMPRIPLEAIKDIIRRVDSGEDKKVIAKDYGTTASSVWRYANKHRAVLGD